MAEPIVVAKSRELLELLPQFANRHGLIAGATGTGKTVTLQRLAEGFSRIGVPVFMADVKGDLAGISQPGQSAGKIKERIAALKLMSFSFDACPTVFWDAFGEQGHPIRTTVSEIGPLLLSRMLDLNDTQAGVLTAVFAELFEQLPEVGDLDKPKLVFFFDEAHLLFSDAPPALLEKIEQVVRLIRSKGVGVYFVTQNPLDIPDTVLGQLGNRVQHALRAFTPRDQKAVKAAATTLRSNPKLDVESAITELEVGEALVSFLDEKGRPSVVQRAFVVPPGCRLGPVSAAERVEIMRNSTVADTYDKAVDRESAFERLAARHGTAAAPAANGKGGGLLGSIGDFLGGTTGPRGGRREGAIEAAAKSAARAIGSGVGREIVRGVLGSLLGGGSRRRR